MVVLIRGGGGYSGLVVRPEPGTPYPSSGVILRKSGPIARDFLQKVDLCLGISRAQIRLLSPVVYSQYVIIRVDIFINPANTLLGGN